MHERMNMQTAPAKGQPAVLRAHGCSGRRAQPVSMRVPRVPLVPSYPFVRERAPGTVIRSGQRLRRSARRDGTGLLPLSAEAPRMRSAPWCTWAPVRQRLCSASAAFLRCERYDQPTDGAKARRDGGTCKVDYRHAEHAAVRLGASSNLRVAHGAHVRACTCLSPPVYSRAIASPRSLRSFLARVPCACVRVLACAHTLLCADLRGSSRR
jgi:hypothetical protein